MNSTIWKWAKILEACELTVGTRLDLAIILMNFSTPAIAINYEHKSTWDYAQQLGLPEMAIDIRHLLDGSLQAMVADTLGQLPALNAQLTKPSVVSVRRECRWCNLCLSASGRRNEGRLLFY